jgi:DHA2 family multidrug resistance protein-like MFS transporter
VKLSDRGRWLALIALALSSLVIGIGIDVTVLNLALPTLATDLHASTAALQWFVASYSLVFAGMMIPAGMLGDRFGRKKMLLSALLVFGVSSLACAYAASSGELLAARAMLGLAAAFVMPLALSVLTVLFPEEERGRAVTVIVGMTLVAYPVGPILGGWLLTRFWWGSVFLINVPVVAIALIAVAVLLPESRSSERPRLDPMGIVTSSSGLAALTYGVIQAGQRGWGDVTAVAGMVGGALLLAAFVAWERRVGKQPGRRPLVDLDLFGSPSFTWGTILMTAVSFAMFGTMFAAPQYFQAILGADPLGSGLRLLPMVGGLIAGGGIADRLARRTSAKSIVGLGFLILAAGLIAGATSGVSSGEGWAATWITICGLGLGFAMPASMNAALGALSAERSGVGSALLQAVRMVGGSFGAALLGSALNSGYRSHLAAPGLPAAAAPAIRDSVFAGIAVAHKLGSPALLTLVRKAFVHGMDVMLLAAGGVAIAGVALALLFLPRREESVAERHEVGTESTHGVVSHG